ncbi:MAG: pirin family protein [Rubrivivax sp.]
MLTLRKSAERGYADHGWLKSFHSFSFADYHDPRHMGVGNLRVINEDRIAPGTGFRHARPPRHGDRELRARRGAGAQGQHGEWRRRRRKAGKAAGVITPGDVQRMSAGTGVMHSEFNHDPAKTTHFLQIWILPRQRGIAPGYEQKRFDPAAKRGKLVLVASDDGREGSVTIHADATLRAGLFDGSERAEIALDPKRLAYVHLVRGKLTVNGRALEGGDALTLDGESQLVLEGGSGAEVLVFDLARLG